MRRKKRERVSCKADTLCPRCAPACKCAQAFPRIRHAQAHVPGFVDLHARYRRRAGLRKAIARRRGGPGAPRVSLSSASFRFRCRSDSDTFSAPTPFRLRCRSYPDVFPTPTSFRFRRFFGSDTFSAPTSFRFQRLPDEAAPGYLRKMQKKSRSWADIGSQRTCMAEAPFDGSYCPIKA